MDKRLHARVTALLWILLLLPLILAAMLGSIVAVAYVMAINHWESDDRDAWLVLPLFAGAMIGVLAAGGLRLLRPSTSRLAVMVVLVWAVFIYFGVTGIF